MNVNSPEKVDDKAVGRVPPLVMKRVLNASLAIEAGFDVTVLSAACLSILC